MVRKILILGLALLLSACANWLVKRKEWIAGKGVGYPLKQEVEIVRDQYGIPHIRAENDEDLFFGLGYAMAQDRFFQMDLLRRAGRGELCELMGRFKVWKIDLLTADKVMRALGYGQRAEAGYLGMAEEPRRLLEAFSAGVNRYLEDAGASLPIYHFLNSQPVFWRPEDSLVLADIFGLTMTYSQLGLEYYYSRALRELGPEKANYLIPSYPGKAPVVIKDLPVVKAEGLEELLLVMRWILNLGVKGLGSNNWVVAPEKSETGFAILSNDPHVPLYPLPSYWYLCHLESKSFNISGMMFPGLPAFGFGYNLHLAWGLTNAMVDHIDIFLERVNPGNPDQYLYLGQWREFEIRKEEIRIKGGKPFVFEFRESVHGPVIDQRILGRNLPVGEEDQVFALKLVDVDLGKFFQGYLEMARAKDWEEFQRGLRNMSLGPVAWNHLYADKDGNIGYWLSGHCPIRPDGQGFLARKGWSGEQDWKGYIPFEELPHLYNPKQKYIASANNKNFSEEYPYYLGAEYYWERISRIDEVLRSKERFSVEDMKELQRDVTLISARKLVPIIISDLSQESEPRIKKALQLLKEWQAQDFKATTDSVGTTLYKLILNKMEALTFNDELKRQAFGASLFQVTSFALQNVLPEPDNPWFDDVRTEKKETRKELLRNATIETIKELERNFGLNPKNWQWGRLSHSYFYTPMGFVPVLGSRHRIGKFPREGASGTVNANEGIFLGPLGWVFVVGPTTRMIVDFGNPAHLQFNACTGNSENLKSGRMGNLTEDWVKGVYHTLSMKREEYEKSAMGKLVLSP